MTLLIRDFNSPSPFSDWKQQNLSVLGVLKEEVDDVVLILRNRLSLALAKLGEQLYKSILLSLRLTLVDKLLNRVYRDLLLKQLLIIVDQSRNRVLSPYRILLSCFHRLLKEQLDPLRSIQLIDSMVLTDVLDQSMAQDADLLEGVFICEEGQVLVPNYKRVIKNVDKQFNHIEFSHYFLSGLHWLAVKFDVGDVIMN